jgi:hypothetical protein
MMEADMKPSWLRAAEDADDALRVDLAYDEMRKQAAAASDEVVIKRYDVAPIHEESPPPFTEAQQDVLTRVLAKLADRVTAERNDEVARLRETVDRDARRITDVENVATMIAADVTAAADRARDRLDAAVAEVRAEVRAILDAQIERGAQALEVRKQANEARVELERQRSATALAERDAKIEKLEMRVQMLCQFLSVSGYDLPRRF